MPCRFRGCSVAPEGPLEVPWGSPEEPPGSLFAENRTVLPGACVAVPLGLTLVLAENLIVLPVACVVFYAFYTSFG